MAHGRRQAKLDPRAPRALAAALDGYRLATSALADWLQAAGRLPPLGELAVVPGPHNANYGAADHLGALVLAFLHRRAQAQGGQVS